MTRCKVDDIELKIVKFSVVGKIHGKGRPRFRKLGKGTYTPAETAKYERKIQCAYIRESDYKSNKALRMSLIIYREMPKSMSKTKRELATIRKLFPTVKPDTDNVLKAVEDALNGVAYHDDNQVVETVIVKTYGLQEGIKVTLEELGLREQAKITKEGKINEY